MTNRRATSLHNFICMPRRYYYRRSYGGRDKYSVEQNTFRIELTQQSDQGNIVCVPATTIEGMRKVKHITISLAENSNGGVGHIYWALVYVPAGYTPNNLTLPNPNAGGALYEPNGFVMNAGCMDTQAGPHRISSPIAKNLNSGDSIYLLLGAVGLVSTMSLTGLIRYAITLQ